MGWAPKISLNEGIKKTIDCYKLKYDDNDFEKKSIN